VAAKLAINGGPKSCDIQWPSWPIWDEAEREALVGVLDSGKWWYGERVAEFEQRFAEFQNAKHGVTSTSGSTALECGLLALGIEAGDEVIVPPYTFMATVGAVVKVNGVPVFADLDGDTLCLDPDDVERKITPKTRGIVPVHLAGYVADMDRLGAIAKAHDLFLLEDACHSWGSQWNGKGTGSLGDCGVFSFQYSKNITGAEGGILLTDDDGVAERVRSYTNCGRVDGKPWYYHENVGGNLRLTEFQAAVLLAQLGRLEEQTVTREKNAKVLDAGLGQISGLVMMKPEPRMTRRAYHLYTLRVDPDTIGMTRAQFVDALTAEGVPATAGYTMPLYKFDFFKQGEAPTQRGCAPYYAQDVDYAGVSCPVCEAVCDTTVWLKHPMLLADADAMHEIVRAVQKVVENSGELT
jgi:dTDP-4-amino-4,6-dideoxygalactose transaminase